MFNFTLRDYIRQAMIASIYVVLVFLFQPISYESLQFRIAELLVIIVLFDHKSIVGLTIGCFVANLFSPLLVYDLTFGTFATFLTLLLMIKTKNLYVRLLYPSLINALIVGFALTLAFETPYLLNMGSVFIGQFVVTYVIGLPLYLILNQNTGFKSLFHNEI
ncbi:MAG: QueT transporter family protein [Acholeplasmataceae bacterium]